MKKILIATDLDGTLLLPDGSVSIENLAAIKRLADKGVSTAPVTGRAFYEIPPQLREFEYIRYFVYSNGAGIYDRQKGNIFYSPVEDGTAVKIFKLLNLYKTFIELYSDGVPKVDKRKLNEECLEYYNIDLNFRGILTKTREGIDHFEDCLQNETFKVEMFDVFFRHLSERVECRNKLAMLFPEVEVTTSMDNNLEIMKKGINKGSGLIKLCEFAGFEAEDVIALGDSRNDLTLFKRAGRSFAVKNACTELRDICDKVICDNKDNVICYIENNIIKGE